MKKYSKEEYPHIDDIGEMILDNNGEGYHEYFEYDGKEWSIDIRGAGTYVEYGIEELDFHIEEKI